MQQSNRIPEDTLTLLRKPDTHPAYRTLFCAVCANIIEPKYLSQRRALSFLNLKVQITEGCHLTDRQFYYLKAIKFEHDMRKRSDAIASGRLRSHFNSYTAKLDVVYNPVGR